MKHHHYSEEERQWLRDNCPTANCFQELTDGFNQRFGLNLKCGTITDYCHKRLGLTNRNGSKQTMFSVGSKARALPIGTIRKSQTATYIKVCDSGKPMSGYEKPDWIPYQQFVYEKANGKVPDGFYVMFLDGNTENFALSNLAVINRRISARLANRGWYTENAEVTRTGVMVCKLEEEMRR